MTQLNSNLLQPLRWAIGKILNWYEGKFIIPPYSEKREIILSYRNKYQTTCFVETGTFMGDTIDVMKNHFELLFSIELADQLAEKAKKRFLGIEKIHILHGNSGEMIKEILPELRGATLFWLDGHFSGEVFIAGEMLKTAKADLNTPILAELESILKHGIGRNVVLIDDARLFNGRKDYPSHSKLVKFLGTFNIQPAQIKIERDIIRITPNHLH